jgi:hypothetical protein
MFDRPVASSLPSDDCQDVEYEVEEARENAVEG